MPDVATRKGAKGCWFLLKVDEISPESNCGFVNNTPPICLVSDATKFAAACRQKENKSFYNSNLHNLSKNGTSVAIGMALQRIPHAKEMSNGIKTMCNLR